MDDVDKQSAEDQAPENEPVVDAPEPANNEPETKPESTDDIVKSASDDVSKEELPHTTNKPPRSKKKLLIVVLLLLIIAAVAGWYFFVRKKAAAPAPSQPAAQTQAAPTYLPDNVAYAYRAKDADPLVVYTRPAAGGERSESQKLVTASYIVNSDVKGDKVAFISDNKLYVSSDSGKTYTQIFEPSAGDNVMDAVFDKSSDQLAIVIYDTAKKGSNVETIDLSGQGEKVIMSQKSALVDILAFDANKQKLVYTTGCAQCDAPQNAPKVRNLADSSDKELIVGMQAGQLNAFAVSNDFSKAIVVENTIDKSIADSEMLGYYIGAPYKVITVDLSNNKSQDVTSIGTKGQKNPNGTYAFESFNVGFLAGTDTPYYTSGSHLYSIDGTDSTELYQVKNSFLIVEYVSKTTIIAGTGEKGGSDYTLTNYDLATKNAVTIFEGDNNTSVFGVTTK